MEGDGVGDSVLLLLGRPGETGITGNGASRFFSESILSWLDLEGDIVGNFGC